jgi:hypothetical protein
LEELKQIINFHKPKNFKMNKLTFSAVLLGLATVEQANGVNLTSKNKNKLAVHKAANHHQHA